MSENADTAWVPAHFIGGHAALDLANAVFDRRSPAEHNELLNSARDVGNWLKASGLADIAQARAVAGMDDGPLLGPVRAIREASYAIFEAFADERPVPAEALGLILEEAGKGLSAGLVAPREQGRPEILHWQAPEAVAALLAMLSAEAFFTLPRERLRACPRCGWLFVDSSRGGKRRWCSMRTCGNREKASRHAAHLH